VTSTKTTPRIPQKPADPWDKLANAIAEGRWADAITEEQRILELLGAIPARKQATA
jgi:hypothetical protein